MATGRIREGLVIESMERLRLSVNGNPRFRITFTDGTVADTQSDAAIAYEIGNPEFRLAPLRVAFSKAGKIAYAEPMES